MDSAGKKDKRLPARARQWVSAGGEALVKRAYLKPGQVLPLVLQPAVYGVDLTDWACGHRALIEQALWQHGGLLFRGFNLTSAAAFEQFIAAVAGAAIEYRERSSPRSQVDGHIYTATDHPANQSIFLHNEQSYNLNFPLRIFFFCLAPAPQGGDTLLADVRKVFARISPAVRARLIEKRYQYVRNFGQGFGLTWQDAFQTTDKSVVAAYCCAHDIEWAWTGDDRLTTRQVRRVAAQHPRTGEMVWFNHATFFHLSTLAPELQRILTSAFEARDLPNNTYYGDGSAIEPAVLDELRAAYRQEQVLHTWQSGDVLMLDNMLVAHGRTPFSGPRNIVVGMSELCNWNEV